MSLLDSIKIALSSILAHKLRSALTMLGIIIGVGSIITVVAIGQGGEAMLKSKSQVLVIILCQFSLNQILMMSLVWVGIKYRN